MSVFIMQKYNILCKPCPFCKSTKLDISSSKKGFQVECYNCGASGPLSVTPQKAVEEWTIKDESDGPFI